MDTPFRRDIVRELCDAARKYDLKIDLYFSHPDWYDADFQEIGAAFEQSDQVCKHTIGKAECRFFSQRAIVDFAVEWMNENRWLPAERGDPT